MSSAVIQIVTTTAAKADAEALAKAVLEKRLAACVQVSGPIESRYWWNNRLETATEWSVTIKTQRELYAEVERLLLELHPYDEPEIMATEVAQVSPGYAKWLLEQVSQRGSAPEASVKQESAPRPKGRKGTSA